MLHQMAALSIQSSPLTISVLLFYLLLIHFCRGQSQLTGSSQPIVATVGDNIILPCHLDPAEDVGTKTLEWTRPDLNPRFVFVWRAGQDLINVKNPSYTGRTSLFTDELKHGNISLKLSKVKPADEGTYKCYIPFKNQESFVELVVASGAASSPVISLSGTDSNRGAVVLECESKGWYPEPEVLWLDGEGNLLSAGPTETVRGPDDLYTVSSRVTVEKRHSNSFTCRVQQNKTNQTREAEIHIQDDFFKVQSSSSSVIIGLAVSLAVCVTLILLLVFLLWKRQNKNTKKIQRDEIDGKKNNSEGNKTEDQFITDGEREREMLMAETEQEREEQNERKEENNTQRSQELQEEQRRREDAEKQLQTMRNEVTEYLLLPFTDLQTLRKKLRDKMSELERIRAELVQYSRISQNSNKAELQKMKQEAEKETERLKEQLEKKETELQTKTKKFAAKQAEPQPRHENQRNREELQIIRSQLQEETERRERAEEEVQRLENQLESKTNEWQKQLKEEKTRRERAEKDVETLKNKLDTKVEVLSADLNKLKQEKQTSDNNQLLLQRELQSKERELKEEKTRRERAEKEVETLKNKLDTESSQVKSSSSSVSQSSTTGPITVDEIDPEGKCICLKNQSHEDQPLGDWEIHVRVNKRKPNIWTFNHSDKVKAKNTVAIWVSERGLNSQPLPDLTCRDLKSWSHVLVTLFNPSGELEVSKEQGLENSQRTSQDSPSDRHITVGEVDQEGRYIRLYNSSYQDQQLRGWEMHVQVNNRKPIMYTFDFLRLGAGQTVTVGTPGSGVRYNAHSDKLQVTLFSHSGEEMDTWKARDES